jgi:hypothetical protein
MKTDVSSTVRFEFHTRVAIWCLRDRYIRCIAVIGWFDSDDVLSSDVHDSHTVGCDVWLSHDHVGFLHIVGMVAILLLDSDGVIRGHPGE